MLSLEAHDALAAVASAMAAGSQEVVFPARQGFSWVSLRNDRQAAVSSLGREVRLLTGGQRTVYPRAQRPILGGNTPLLEVLVVEPDLRRLTGTGARRAALERPGDVAYDLYVIGSGSLKLRRVDVRS